MTELLSCPFCGGRAAAGRTYNGETTLFKVQCMSCPAAMKGYDQSVADAIDAWNTRPAPVPQCEAEPVAWRVKNDHGHWYITQNRALAETYEKIERKDVQPLYATPPSRSDAVNAGLRQALERSVVAIDDWLNTYAPDLCHEDRVKEAAFRISEHGTLWYIASVQEQNRAALSRSDPGTVTQ